MLLSTIGAVSMIAPAVVLSIYINNTYFRCFACLSLTYPFGEWLQYMVIGPGWIRWHVSDVGFISSFGLLFAVFHYLGRFASHRFTAETFPNRLLMGTSIGFVLAIASEVLKPSVRTMLIPDQTSKLDWIDIIIFCLSFGLNYWLISRMKKS